DAICGNKTEAISGIAVGFQFLPQVIRAGMFIDLAIDDLTSAQTRSVDDAGMIEPVAVDDVAIRFRAEFLVRVRGKEALVRCETRGEENRVFGTQKCGNLFLEPSVNRQRAAQKSDGRDAIAELVYPANCSFFDSRV